MLSITSTVLQGSSLVTKGSETSSLQTKLSKERLYLLMISVCICQRPTCLHQPFNTVLRLWSDSTPVLRCEEMPRTRNQCTPLVGTGTGSNPILHNFYGLSFETDFQSHAFFAINMNSSRNYRAWED